MMTESEALETYCPFFAAALIVRDGDMTAQNEKAGYCLGGLCMLWRWKTDREGYCCIANKGD